MLGLGPFGNARDRLPFAAPFALRCRISFLMREASARSLAAVLRDVLRGAGSGARMSILAKRRCPLTSLRRPTMR